MRTESHSDWKPAEADLEAILADHPRPLEALAAGDTPALVLRDAYPRAACEQLIDRLIARQLLFDPDQPIAEKFHREAIPEGFYREGLSDEARQAWRSGEASPERLRIDIGTSLGYRGSDPESFFAHAGETRQLFSTLFDGLPDPVKLIYQRLSDLSLGKRVVTAREPDGRTYGPAIIRAHYGAYTYRPHFDSVQLREERQGYAVYRFDHQFAGVLVLQNTERRGETAQCILHRYLWQPEVNPYLEEGTFDRFARARAIESFRVDLEPGDLYFFNTRLIHEVPGVNGRQPRVVLATFIGYGEHDDEIFVWS